MNLIKLISNLDLGNDRGVATNFQHRLTQSVQDDLHNNDIDVALDMSLPLQVRHGLEEHSDNTTPMSLNVTIPRKFRQARRQTHWGELPTPQSSNHLFNEGICYFFLLKLIYIFFLE